jgi:hypothetical protein
VLLALVAACSAVFLPGAVAENGAVFKVSFSFTAVGQEQPPNIVESRRVGKGGLTYSDSPVEGKYMHASDGYGTIALAYDFLTPEPHTAKLQLVVLDGGYASYPDDGGLAILNVKVSASSSAQCPRGVDGSVSITKTSTKSAVLVNLPGCHIHEGQRATNGKNSRVHVTFLEQCLREAAAVGKPLCSTKTSETLPLLATIGGSSSGPKKSVTSTKVFGPGEYTIRISGVANTWPSKADFSPFSQDALYCYDGCAKFNNPGNATTARLSPLIAMQLPGGGWGEFGHLGPGKWLPYDMKGHAYTQTVTVAAKGKFSFAFQDTQPDDNTGVFTIAISGG